MSEKKTYKYPENHLGIVTKSKKGDQYIKVEQDLNLKKGDSLWFNAPHENAPDFVLKTVSKIVKKD